MGSALTQKTHHAAAASFSKSSRGQGNTGTGEVNNMEPEGGVAAACAGTSQPEPKQRGLKNRHQNATQIGARLPQWHPDFVHNRSHALPRLHQNATQIDARLPQWHPDSIHNRPHALPRLQAKQRGISFTSYTHSLKTRCPGHLENRCRSRTMEAINRGASRGRFLVQKQVRDTSETGQISRSGVACALPIWKVRLTCLLQSQNLHQTQRLQKSHICCKLRNSSDTIGLPSRPPSPTPIFPLLPARLSPGPSGPASPQKRPSGRPPERHPANMRKHSCSLQRLRARQGEGTGRPPTRRHRPHPLSGWDRRPSGSGAHHAAGCRGAST